MKKLFSLGLAAALALSLAACAPKAESPAPPETTATAEVAAAEATVPAGDFYSISSTYVNSPGFNAGDAWYSLENHLGYCLVTKTDYATATRSVVCSVPGCTHDSESCPAWLPGRGTSLEIFTAGDTVYVCHPVPTMNYQGSWDNYYAEVVEPKLQERPAGLENLTEEELVAYYKNIYAEASAPSGFYCIEGNGASRKNVETSQNLRQGILRWCDGTALYGQSMDGTNGSTPTGCRVDLADGSVTTFPMVQEENIVGAQGTKLLTTHPVTDTPLADPNEIGWDVYWSLLQNSTVEYDWLDPVTGERTKVLERPHDGSTFGNMDFFGLRDGKLYFEDWTPLEEGGSQRNAYCAYDTATGQWRDLLRPIPDASMHLPYGNVVALPEIAAQQGQYLWFTGSDNVNGENLAWVLDTQSGTLTAVQQEMTRSQLPHQAVQYLAQTDDGRFLLKTSEGETEESYALIGIEAFLQGSTDYTPIAEE